VNRKAYKACNQLSCRNCKSGNISILAACLKLFLGAQFWLRPSMHHVGRTPAGAIPGEADSWGRLVAVHVHDCDTKCVRLFDVSAGDGYLSVSLTLSVSLSLDKSLSRSLHRRRAACVYCMLSFTISL